MRHIGAFYLSSNHKQLYATDTSSDHTKFVEFVVYTAGIDQLIAKLKSQGYVQGLSEQNCLDMLGIPTNTRG